MPSNYDNHQAEKERYWRNFKKYSQQNIYIKIVYNSFLCMCILKIHPIGFASEWIKWSVSLEVIRGNEYKLRQTIKYVVTALIWLKYRLIGQVVRVFANGPENLGSIPGHVIPKTLKMVLDTSLLNTQQYKVRIKGKMEQSRERSSALPYNLV